MLLIKSDERTEAGILPGETFLAAISQFNEELAKAGALLSAEGFHPSSKGARLKLADGKRTLTRGPFGEPENLIAGYWIIQADSKADAIEWAKRVPFEADEARTEGGGVGQIEVRQLFDLEDFPVNENESGWREQEAEFRAKSERALPVASVQKPADGTPMKRFFCITNADANSEAGALPSEGHLAAMGEFTRNMIETGIMIGGDGLQPSSNGARVTFTGGLRIVTDGPFIETKELIGGFGIIQAPSLDAAIECSWRFMEVDGEWRGGEQTGEIRQILDMSDFPA